MKKLQTWVALTAVVVLAVLAGGWFLLVSPKRAAAADLRTQAATQRSAVAALRVQLATLQAQEQALPAQKKKLDAVLAKLPSAAQVPDLIRTLTGASAGSSVELVSFAPGALAPLAAPAAATAPVPATTSTGTTSPATTSPATTTGATTPAAATTAGGPGATAPPTASGLQVMPLTLQVVGGYANLERYLNELESTSRAVRVTSLSLSPGTSPVDHAPATGATDGSSLKVAITAQVYVYTPPATASGSATAPTPAK